MKENYKKINKEAWNTRVGLHLPSEFYKMDQFLDGATSLKEIELDLLGDVSGKKILHLQCHFGQDSLSLARMGAKVTGVDISDEAINQAKQLNEKLELDAKFVCCDIYDLPDHLNEEKFDIVFTSYGTIIWLPDLDKWAAVVSHFLQPKGRFVFVDFHPIVEMCNTDFSEVQYGYFNEQAFEEVDTGSYASGVKVELKSVTWNHPLSEVFTALIGKGLTIKKFQEFNYSPYNCFNDMQEVTPGRYQFKKVIGKIPMVYALECGIESTSRLEGARLKSSTAKNKKKHEKSRYISHRRTSG